MITKNLNHKWGKASWPSAFIWGCCHTAKRSHVGAMPFDRSFVIVSSLSHLWCSKLVAHYHTAISEIGFTSKCTMVFAGPNAKTLVWILYWTGRLLIEGRCKYCMKEWRTIQNYATSIKLKNTYFTLAIAPLVNLLQSRQTTHSCSRCLEDLPFGVNFPSLVWRLTCDSSYSDIRNQIYRHTLMNYLPNPDLKHANLILVLSPVIPAGLYCILW